MQDANIRGLREALMAFFCLSILFRQGRDGKV